MAEPQPKTPPSIPIIGWTTLIASVLLAFLNIISLFTYNVMDQMGLSLPALSQHLSDSMKGIMELYRYQRIWTMYNTGYLIVVAIAAIQFLRLRASGRAMLEIACWVGLFNAFVDTAISYYIWKGMQSLISAVFSGIGGGQYSSLNSIGYYSIVIGFFLWIIPCIGMIIYLRRPIVRGAVNRI
ncbi:MAG: hypothetical protein HY088_01505 [Ignavibacteriales bacterium]|nr:hypothetical protein [Ignavibacteriales bacterium]